MRIKTACPLDCYDGCSIVATVEDNRVVRLDGNPDHPITRGALCNRGRRLGERRDGADRILHPLKKVDGAWVQVSWETAISEIAEQVRQTLAEEGHHGILHAYDWGSGAVLKSLNQRFFYSLGGCTETVGSLCWEAGLEAQRYDFGQARSHSPFDMANNSDAIVVWGRNVATTNVHMMPFIKQAQARGAKVVVVNPLATDLSRRADLSVYPRPGTDAVLAFGVLHICRAKGYLDRTFLDTRSVGWKEFEQVIDNYPPEIVSRETNVSRAEIDQLAGIYGTSGAVTTLLGIGMQRYAGGGNAIRAIDALAAATGHIGVPGGGINYAERHMSAYFDEEALTGRQKAIVREFVRGTQAIEILEASPAIRVMFVTRTNPLTQVPDSALLRKAYDSIRCKVVIDTYMTKTAEHADYVLPCTNVLEEEDVTFSTMWHSYISYIQPIVPPRGEAKPDWQIFRDLAEELGMKNCFEGNVESWLRQVLSPFEKVGLTLADLKEQGFVRLPVEEVPWSDGDFLTPSGKFEFFAQTAIDEGKSGTATYIAPVSRNQERYPFTLLSVHPRKHENSQREQMAPQTRHPVVEIPEAAAHGRKLENGQYVRVFNEKASMIGIVKVQSAGDPRTIRIESGWWGQGITINDFTHTRLADFGLQTTQYDCACDIEPVQAPVIESGDGWCPVASIRKM